MEEQAEGSWIFRPAFFDVQEDVSGHHGGRVGDEGIEVPALGTLSPVLGADCPRGRIPQCPSAYRNADNVIIGKGEVRGKQGQPVSLVLVA